MKATMIGWLVANNSAIKSIWLYENKPIREADHWKFNGGYYKVAGELEDVIDISWEDDPKLCKLTLEVLED